MTFLEAQLEYLFASERYAREGTEIARRAVNAAASRVDRTFRALFPSVALPPTRAPLVE